MESSSTVEILLVEDNEDDSILISEVFADARLATVINRVRDGEEGLAYLRREGSYRNARRPGLVLLDINMPRKNGFEMLAEMKSDAELQSLPVVMLTMSEREEDVLRSYKQGACSYVKKPVNLGDFKRVVNQFQTYWTQVVRIPAN
jgi:CheY-like chemotaxis protein